MSRPTSTPPTILKSSLRYAVFLALAHLLSVVEVLVVAVALGSRTPGMDEYRHRYLVSGAVLTVICTLVVLVVGTLIMGRTLRWFASGELPSTKQRRAALNLIRDQSVLLSTVWAVGGAAFIVPNLDCGPRLALSIGLAVALGGAAATSTAVMLTQRTVRPIIAAAAEGFGGFVRTPGVLARLINMWLVSSGLPNLAIAVLVVLRLNGWLIPQAASVDTAVVILALVAVMLGWRGMTLVSRSISDPVGEVVEAMAEIERGGQGRLVDVYERSEIGRLQSGFNRMVAELRERDRLRDLFGRHVGPDVARRAIEEGASLSGEVEEAAILFVDLTGSTQLALTYPPERVAEVLNDFFRIVVGAVDERRGLINKFQGDAVLAVFGVPLRSTDGAASAALATARSLGERLRRLPVVDFGIGVSAGPVFAGNIGAANRYEYTVIGDAVNEAARLADLAKTSPQRVLCSAAAVDRADASERQRWADYGSTVLRGRSEATRISSPHPVGQAAHPPSLGPRG